MVTFSKHVVMHVINTLTAVRATLSDEEQAFLDQLLRNASFEIASDEVEGQSTFIRGADQGSNAFGPDEVEGQGNVAFHNVANEPAARIGIAFDPDQGTYVIRVIRVIR